MKKVMFIICMTVMSLFSNLFSQESIVFDKQYLFDNQGSYIRDVKQTSDSGYICAGSIGFDIYDERFLLFKTDSMGEIQWYKFLSNSGVHDWNEAVNITKTGNIVTVGHTQNNYNWHDSGSIIMYSGIGDTLWTKQYAFNSLSNPEENSKMGFLDCILPQDNSILAVGYINEEDYGTNPLIVKTNMDGDTIWTWRLYDTNNVIVLREIEETIDGHYVAVGIAEDSVFINTREYSRRRGIIVKLNSEGEQQLFYEWTDLPDCGFECLSVDNFGNYLIGGFNYKHWPDVEDTEYYGLIIKTDSLGNTIWKKNVAYGKSISCLDIDVNSMDEIICLNSIEPPYYENWKMDVILEKYSTIGELLWSKIIGEQTAVDWPYSLTQTSDGGFAFCGLYASNTGNYSWLVKTDSLGGGVYGEGWINNLPEDFFDDQIQVYPNPVSDLLYIESLGNGTLKEIKIYDIYGRVILTKRTSESQIIIDVSGIENGLYILETNNVYSGKIVIQN